MWRELLVKCEHVHRNCIRVVFLCPLKLPPPTPPYKNTEVYLEHISVCCTRVLINFLAAVLEASN